MKNEIKNKIEKIRQILRRIKTNFKKHETKNEVRYYITDDDFFTIEYKDIELRHYSSGRQEIKLPFHNTPSYFLVAEWLDDVITVLQGGKVLEDKNYFVEPDKYAEMEVLNQLSSYRAQAETFEKAFEKVLEKTLENRDIVLKD